MKNVRMHMIGALCSSRRAEPDDLLDIVKRAQEIFSHKSLVARLPPPERDILLTLCAFDKPSYILGMSLDRLFGIALEASFIIENGHILLDADGVLEVIFLRVAGQNKLLRHYGLKLSIYAPFEEEICQSLYLHFASWTAGLSAATNLPISFDIARDYSQFEHILENEHRRMVYGDIRAQCAALNS